MFLSVTTSSDQTIPIQPSRYCLLIFLNAEAMSSRLVAKLMFLYLQQEHFGLEDEEISEEDREECDPEQGALS